MSLPESRSTEGGHLESLDALRGLTALYVLLHHAQLLPNSRWGLLLSFGQEAVILFFLLSGFVIDHSLRNRRFNTGRYLQLRTRRIYPIFLVALLLSYAAQCVIQGQWAPPMWRDLMGNLLMLQDAAGLKRGVWFDTFQGNSALWSLSYEWCFYLLFIPVVRLIRPSLQAWTALAISVAGWLVFNAIPNQIALLLSYFMIWWSGVALSREYSVTGRISLAGQTQSLGGLAMLSLMQLAAIGLAWKAGQPLKLGIDPVLQLRHYGAAFVFLLVAIVWNSRGWRTPAWVRIFALAAPISYGIYIIHLPLLAMVRHLTGLASGPLNLLIALPVILGAAWLLEVKLQKAINRRWRI